MLGNTLVGAGYSSLMRELNGFGDSGHTEVKNEDITLNNNEDQNREYDIKDGDSSNPVTPVLDSGYFRSNNNNDSINPVYNKTISNHNIEINTGHLEDIDEAVIGALLSDEPPSPILKDIHVNDDEAPTTLKKKEIYSHNNSYLKKPALLKRRSTAIELLPTTAKKHNDQVKKQRLDRTYSCPQLLDSNTNNNNQQQHYMGNNNSWDTSAVGGDFSSTNYFQNAIYTSNCPTTLDIAGAGDIILSRQDSPVGVVDHNGFEHFLIQNYQQHQLLQQQQQQQHLQNLELKIINGGGDDVINFTPPPSSRHKANLNDKKNNYSSSPSKESSNKKPGKHLSKSLKISTNLPPRQKIGPLKKLSQKAKAKQEKNEKIKQHKLMKKRSTEQLRQSVPNVPAEGSLLSLIREAKATHKTKLLEAAASNETNKSVNISNKGTTNLSSNKRICCINNYSNKSVSARRWTKEEDQILRKAVEKFNASHWKSIAELVPNRDHVQCLQRWKKVLKPGLVKGAWQPHEDKALVELINRPGINGWSQIAKEIPGRTPKQCRERWSLSLDPSINREPWSEEEDNKLLEMHKKYGASWAEIRYFFNGRTENAVKTRFNCLIRSLKRDETIIWNLRLAEQLINLGKKFDKNLVLVQKRLPRALKGISSSLMRKIFTFETPQAFLDTLSTNKKTSPVVDNNVSIKKEPANRKMCIVKN